MADVAAIVAFGPSCFFFNLSCLVCVPQCGWCTPYQQRKGSGSGSGGTRGGTPGTALSISPDAISIASTGNDSEVRSMDVLLPVLCCLGECEAHSSGSISRCMFSVLLGATC